MIICQKKTELYHVWLYKMLLMSKVNIPLIKLKICE
jgi:hypothetical protein